MVKSTRLTPLERGLLALVLVASLLLRVTATDVFWTPDEIAWHDRSIRFAEALSRHDWAATFQTGHPGVLTMWAGAIAHRVPPVRQFFIDLADVGRGLLNAPASAPGTGLPPLATGARGLIGFATWLTVIALYPLLRRLFSARTALLGTALVALDPFFLALSRLHHLDGLLTAFMTLSIGCLLVYRFRSRRLGYLLASGATAALAMANKSPGVMLVPWTGLVLLLPVLQSTPEKRRQELLAAARDLALWGAVLALVFVAVWPSMWVNPVTTLRDVFALAEHHTETPHENSNYFWFAERPNPGPLFYPVAWAFRATPGVLLGLVALAVYWRNKEERLPVALLGLAVLLYAGMMTVGDKKFDRYLLPVFPLLSIVAAAGWASLAGYCRAAWPRWSHRPIAALLPALVIAQFVLLWPTRPYYLTYYNPLLGGGKAAARVLLVGWGEGLDRAAAYLNAKPNASDLLVGTSTFNSLFCLLKAETYHFNDNPCLYDADYFVTYANAVQRNLVPSPVADYLHATRPEYVVSLNGIDYAWVYENRVHREGSRVLERIAEAGDPGRDVILLDVDAGLGRRYQGGVPLQVLPVPGREDVLLSRLQSLAQDGKRLWRLVYPEAEDVSQEVTQRIAQQCTAGDEIVVGGARAVRYDSPAEPHFVPAEPQYLSGARFGEQIMLVGYDISDNTLAPEEPFRVRLYWQTNGPVDVSYTVFTQLVDGGYTIRGQSDSLPQGGARCTNTWQAGEVIIDDHLITVAPDAPPGDYALLVGMYDLETMQRVRATAAVGRCLPDGALRLDGFRVVQRGQ